MPPELEGVELSELEPDIAPQPLAPQPELPVALPLVVVVSGDAELPPEVEGVLVSVVDDEPEALDPPPHAERPSSADAATTSEAFVLMFIGFLPRF